MSTEKIFLESAIKRFKEYKNLGEKTFAQLNDEAMLYEPNHDVNSIAVIIQHMHGNMLSRWTNFLTEDGEKEWRKRDEEFEIKQLSKEEIVDLWNEGWKACLNALESLTPDDLQKSITIRQQPLSVIDAINRQLAHYSYHVGQIVFLGKCVKGAAWQSLSIPKGNSQQYNQQMMQQHKS
jgi:hypothetical protein